MGRTIWLLMALTCQTSAVYGCEERSTTGACLPGSFGSWVEQGLDAAGPSKQVECYSKALESWLPADGVGNKAVAYRNLGLAYDQLGDHQSAIRNLDMALELSPKDSTAFLFRGIAHYNSGEYVKALQSLDRAVELNSRGARAYLVRGAIYAEKQGAYDKAIEDLSTASEIVPDEPAVFVNRCLVFIYKGDYSKAIEDCSKAILLNPTKTGGYLNRANAFIYVGDYEKAAEDLKTSAELEPENAYVPATFGELEFMLGKSSEALGHLGRALELSPDPMIVGHSYLFKIRILVNDRDISGADRALKEAKLRLGGLSAKHPNEGIIYAYLAESQCEIGEDPAGAWELAKKAVSLKPDYYSYYVLGRSLVDKGDPLGGLQAFNRSLRLNPNYAWCAYWKGRVYKQYLRDIAKSKASFKSVLAVNPRFRFALDELEGIRPP
ncbi:MAG: tetratricopeptide repeat protein [Elusimicrobia bacterium]|nr:tetratricopeptide repeat protein [Elusimicrobiota bacterium]